jgi:hypothetical protein
LFVRRLSLVLLGLLQGCVYQELTAPHVEAGGVVTAALNGGAPLTAKGLGDATKDPFSISGFSPLLTFGVIAPASYTAPLAMPSMAVELPINTSGYVQLQVHADGSGCVAQTGTLQLATDAGNNLTGSFDAAGVVPDGTDTCTMSGTLQGVPVMR